MTDDPRVDILARAMLHDRQVPDVWWGRAGDNARKVARQEARALLARLDDAVAAQHPVIPADALTRYEPEPVKAQENRIHEAWLDWASEEEK